jgi:V/A-type H+/Na+-transporting ATPase subunit D
MARLKLSATRSNLLAVRQRLRLAREGHRLLNKKRDVLIMEILRMIQDAERVSAQAREQFQRGYAILQEARAAMGTERVRRIALSKPQEADVRIIPYSIMGVVVPRVHYEVPSRRLAYGLGDTSVVLDEAQQEWAAIRALMGELAEKVTTVWRLALELRRTQRRVNALEHIFIPSYEETVVYIEETLEEKDREELFRTKRAKAKIGAERAQEGF